MPDTKKDKPTVKTPTPEETAKMADETVAAMLANFGRKPDDENDEDNQEDGDEGVDK